MSETKHRNFQQRSRQAANVPVARAFAFILNDAGKYRPGRGGEEED